MAATDARPIPFKNAAYRVYFPILDADGDPVTGATGLDSEVSIDGAAFSDATNEATEIGTSGIYYLDLVQAEMNGDAIVVQVKTSSAGAKTTPIVLYPQESDDLRVSVTHFGGTAGTFAAGRPEVNTSHVSGTAQTARDLGATLGVAGAGLSAIPWNAAWDAEVQSEVADALAVYDPPTRAELTSDIDSILAILGTPAGASLAADLLAIDNFVDGLEASLADATFGLSAIETLVDELESRLTAVRAGYLDNLSAGAAALQTSVDDLEGRLTAALATALQAHGLGIGRGVVDASSTTTAVIFKSVNGAAASAVNDFYNGRHIVFTSGALALQATSISDYTGASRTATVPALTSAPAEDVTFIIV